MKKFFTFVMALTAVMAINAKQVVFDFSDPASLGVTAPEKGKATNITSPIVYEGVTMTGTKGTTDFRFYNSNDVITLRVYKSGGTVTFAAEENIECVVFEGSAVDFAEMTGKTWAGTPANSVTFTANTNCTLSSATIYIGEKPEIWVPDTITVAQANVLIDSADTKDHFVKGVVMCQPFITYDTFKDKVSFWMNDIDNPADTIEFYDGMGLDNKKWASLEAAWEELRIGDTILVYAGGLASYTNTKTGITFNEITGGYYAEKLGANPNPPAIVYPTVDTITVDKALEIAKSMNPDAGKSETTKDEYVVGGYIVGVSTKYENTWYMADEPGVRGDFQAFKCDYVDTTVNVGDYVYVRGKIQTYHGTGDSGDYYNYEISYGSLVHGEAPAPVVLEPITVAEALEIAKALTPEKGTSEKTTEKYAVKGYIVNVKDAAKKTYHMADEAGAFGEFQAYRCATIDSDVNEGDLVIVTGYIEHYYGESEKGDFHNYEISGGTLVHAGEQGIENVSLTEKVQKIMLNGSLYIIRNGKMYDVRGAQVR